MQKFILIIMITTLAACATVRYGRETRLSEYEKQNLTCHEIKLEIAKSQQFLSDIQEQRSNTNINHVAGALGDLGIGNRKESNAAIASGKNRMNDLESLKLAKNCK